MAVGPVEPAFSTDDGHKSIIPALSHVYAKSGALANDVILNNVKRVIRKATADQIDASVSTWKLAVNRLFPASDNEVPDKHDCKGQGWPDEP
ncbi:hypothetical protein FIV00_15330 [Labrenzia sp. THAF82]|nr:hypothetical protein FIV00_15330 [Labrenzia sp. THAF82]